MRTIGVLALIGSLGFASAAGAATVGEPAPAFAAKDVSGTPRSLDEFKGKFVVLEWFNNDCPFVRKHYDSGNMQQLQADYTAKGVVWLSINSSAEGKEGHLTPEAGAQVVAERQAKQTALLLDPTGEVGKLYGAKTTPHIFIINPEGTLIYAGAIDDIASTELGDIPKAKNYVKMVLDEAMANRPVPVSDTRAYGCSVKY
jgi:peroxiredoxin